MKGTYNFLAIGHCCHDLHEGEHILGGTTAYASMVAKNLGWDPVVFTCVGRDFKFFQSFKQKGIPFYYKLGQSTTQFENRYKDGEREQYILSRADDILVSDLPKAYKNIPIVLLGPIADEIAMQMIGYFSQSTIGLAIQGFLRKWDGSGKVLPKPMNWSLLEGVDITFLSDEDLNGLDVTVNVIKRYSRMVVMTLGKNGAKVFYGDEEYFFPSFPVEEADVTGAGDTFATAFLLHYYTTRDISSSCIYAHCAASFIVQGVGIDLLPTEKEIQERIVEYHKLFA